MMKFMTGSPMRFQLRFLLDESRAPAVSIFLPTHRAGQEIRQDPIRLKNLVRQAEQQLIDEGTRAAEACNLLEPVAALVEDSAFWRRQAEGLAVFRSPDVPDLSSAVPSGGMCGRVRSVLHQTALAAVDQ
jgi:hypothetical protein